MSNLLLKLMAFFGFREIVSNRLDGEGHFWNGDRLDRLKICRKCGDLSLEGGHGRIRGRRDGSIGLGCGGCVHWASGTRDRAIERPNLDTCLFNGDILKDGQFKDLFHFKECWACDCISLTV